MDAQKLTRDELVYELRVRGYDSLATETVKSMRKQLSSILKTEEFGAQCRGDDQLQPKPVEEISTCTEKVEQLEAYVLSYVGLDRSPANYIEAKLRHLYGRLQRVKVDDSEENQPLVKAIANLIVRLGKVEQTVDDLDEQAQSTLIQNEAIATEASNQPGMSTPSVVNAPVVNLHKYQCEPRKWGIKFSGEAGLSVSAFLEQLEIKRRSSNLSHAELLLSLPDLLDGCAAVWYEAVREEIISWSTFQDLIRGQFQPYFYERDLWREIWDRHQGEHERVGIYFAFMHNLFKRLPTPPTGEKMLEVLRHNIHPYYIHNLGLATYSTVRELQELCKKLEQNREVAQQGHRPPTNNTKLLEPDLAYKAPAFFRTTPKVMVVSTSLRCWNCKEVGHTFAQCREERKSCFCFKCGKQGVIKSNCPECSGNGQGDETTVRRPNPVMR